MKKDYWIRFGCFITGYNYRLLIESGEASKKSLKKFTAALIIISIIWAANGYNFAKRYLDANILGAFIAAFVMIVIVIQIERQIILTVRPKPLLKWFRAILAILMAFIGSVIIDQILFSKDLDKLREDNITQNEQLKANYLSIKREDSIQMSIKRIEISKIDSGLNKLNNLLISKGGNTVTETRNYDTTGADNSSINKSTTLKKKTTEFSDVSPLIESQKISNEAKKRLSQEINDLIKKQNTDYKTFKQSEKPFSNGFFGEIKLLIEFITLQGAITWVIYIFWLIFFFVLEVLVLVAKSTDDANDYERRVEYELDSNLKKINFLSTKSSRELQ